MSVSMESAALPFPRGTTWGDGQVTLTDTSARRLEGTVWTVPDTKHTSGMDVQLRVVKNHTGHKILTGTHVLLRFATNASEDFGRRILGTSALAGVCKPVDDAYASARTITNNDLFYCLESGPCRIRFNAGTPALEAGTPLKACGRGTIAATAATERDYAVGVLLQDASAANTKYKVLVHPGLRKNR